MSDAPIVVTLRLAPSNPTEFMQFLAKTLPETRAAKGCRYNKTCVNGDAGEEVMLVQEWGSLEDQQAYMNWRESTGVLEQFIGSLSKSPEVQIWQLNKA